MNLLIPAQAILAGMFMLSVLMKFGRTKKHLLDIGMTTGTPYGLCTS